MNSKSPLRHVATLGALAATSLLLVAHGAGPAPNHCADYPGSQLEFDVSGDCGVEGRVQVFAGAASCDVDLIGYPEGQYVDGGRTNAPDLSQGGWQFSWARSEEYDNWICDVGSPRDEALPVRCNGPNSSSTCTSTFVVVESL